MNVLPPTIGLPPSLEGLAGIPGERETVCARQLETARAREFETTRARQLETACARGFETTRARQLETACAWEFETTRARELDTARGQAVALRIRVDGVATR